MADETQKETFERGQKEGRTDALLAEHGLHLDRINGSVGDAAKALRLLTEEVHNLSDESRFALQKVDRDLRDALREIASDIRTLREEQRIRDERVQVAADVLKDETERRRGELAAAVEASDRGAHTKETSFTRKQQLAALTIGALSIIVTLVITQPWS